MKVLIVGNASGVAMEQWVTEMQARGHEIRLMSPEPPRSALAAVTVSSEWGPRIPVMRFLARILRIRRELRSYRPDVLHAHGAHGYALWTALTGFLPTLVTCWGSDVLVAPERSVVDRLKIRLGLRSASYVTATSWAALQRASDVAGRTLAGEVIHWGVDLDRFRRKRSRNSQEILILSVRQHKPIYNLDCIIRAFARLNLPPNARLLVAGTGPDTNELRRLAVENGVADRTEFLGWIEQDSLPELYARADVYVSVPSSDASSVSNMEAMASGLAVIVSDLPSAREWVEDGVDGVIVAAGDVGQLSAALERLCSDQALRGRFGTAARKKVEIMGARASQMDRVSEVYECLADGTLP